MTVEYPGRGGAGADTKKSQARGPSTQVPRLAEGLAGEPTWKSNRWMLVEARRAPSLIPTQEVKLTEWPSARCRHSPYMDCTCLACSIHSKFGAC